MISKFSVKRPYTVLVAVIMVIVFGVVSFTRLTPDLFPKFDLPYVAVMTTYPGASAQEIEETVTAPLEQQLASLENLKSIQSQSQKNASVIFLEFEQDASLDTVSVDIRDKAELASASWDEAIQKPIIMKMNPSMIPVTVAGISQKGSNIAETSRLLEDGVLRKLEGTEGVASVTTTGTVENTVHISVDSKKVDEVNRKISNAVTSGFANAKDQINEQIESGKSAADSLAGAKEEIKEGQKTLAESTGTVKTMLQKLKTLATNKESLQAVNAAKEAGAKAMLEQQFQGVPVTEEMIAEALATDSDYMTNSALISQYEAGINAIVEALRPSAQMLSSMGIDIDTLYTLDGICTAEQNLNDFITQSNNEMGNSLSEITGQEALLNSANMQLQSSLANIESQESSAKDSADVSSYLTVDGISGIITAQNFEMPAGYVSEDGKDVLVTVGNQIESSNQLKNLVLLDMGLDGVDPVTLSDVANITYIAEGEDTYSKINEEDAILLVFSKQSDYSTTEVANNVLDKFEQIEKEYKGVEFSVLSDQGDYIKLAVKSVLESVLLGGIFAILILLFFLRDIKPTLVTAISIPISITFAIVLMYFSGITLNVISLSGLAVGVGMLVDNSIVVVENIYRFRSLGYSKREAAQEGAKQVAGAITASTITTICVFAPILFTEGLTKIIIKDMALTVTYSLLASLIVALTVVPAVASRLFDKSKENTLLEHDGRTLNTYRKALEKVLNHKVVTMLVVVGLLAAVVAGTLVKGFIFMPEMASPQISATVEMFEDADRDDTVRIGDKIADEVSKIDGVTTVGATLSSGVGGILGGSGGSDDFSSITFYILVDEEKLENNGKIKAKIEKICKENKCEASVTAGMDISMLMGGSGISVNIEGDDLDSLRTATVMAENALKKMDGIQEVSNINENSTEEIILHVNTSKAASYGLTAAQIYAQVAEKISTEKTATSVDYSGDSRKVIVSAKEENTISKDALLNMNIKSQNKGSSETVKLSSLVTVEKSKTLERIARLNQKRTETVTATLKSGENITLMSDKAEKVFKDIDFPEGVSYEFGGENEEIMHAMKQMVLLALMGCLLIYLVMVAQFQSLLLPFIVMFTVPLAVTGGFIGLLVTGNELSVVAMIGAVMLMGIIVNNGIVLIDYINHARGNGMTKREAVIEAGSVRIRPVLMTALTTVLGLLPMAFGTGSGAEMIQPVAIVCIGGLIYATLLTLFIIPLMYEVLGPKKFEN